MADYTPVHLPGLTWTSTASGAVTGGDPVEVAGSGLVRRCVTGAAYVGVAAEDAATGVLVTVISVRPVHEGLADGTVTAGDLLVPSTVAGRQVKTLAADAGVTPTQESINAAITVGLGVCGVALTTAADGNTIRWQQRLPEKRNYVPTAPGQVCGPSDARPSHLRR